MIVELDPKACNCGHNPSAAERTEPLKSGPPRVDDIEKYWASPPPELSPRCTWWLGRIRGGWRPSRHVAGEGYYTSAKYFGVYIWEYLHGIAPCLDAWRARDGR